MGHDNLTQLSDGRWVPAQPLPMYADTRPWHIKVWHSLLIIWGYNEDQIDDLIEPYWVPMEPANKSNRI